MKTIIISKIFGLEYNGQAHELTATSAADLSNQVQTMTGQRAAAQLARTMWAAERGDLTAAGVRISSLGEIRRVTWASINVAKTEISAPMVNGPIDQSDTDADAVFGSAVQE